MNGKKDITINNAFQKLLDESNRKPNKIRVDKGSEFYNRSMKSWIEKNDIQHIMNTFERFIRFIWINCWKIYWSLKKQNL